MKSRSKKLLDAFLGVRCWRRDDLTLERLRKVASSVDLPVSLVEREIIFYDTLEAVCSFSRVPVVLKGGVLISRVYSEFPRFSWDIDLSAAIRSKEDFPLEVLNRELRRNGGVWSIRVGRGTVEFGKFERDVEKDVFVDLLSLKRDMVTLSLGASFPTYLKKVGSRVDGMRRDLSKLKEAFGFLPFVDSVRATVSIAEPATDMRRVRVGSIIGDVLKPIKTVRALAYPPELCLVEKFSRMSKGVGEIGLRDFLFDFYDVGQLLRLKLRREKIRKCFKELYFGRRIAGPSSIRRGMEEGFSILRRNLDLFERRREFTWCEYDWDEYFASTEEGVWEVLEDLSLGF